MIFVKSHKLQFILKLTAICDFMCLKCNSTAYMLKVLVDIHKHTAVKLHEHNNYYVALIASPDLIYTTDHRFQGRRSANF